MVFYEESAANSQNYWIHQLTIWYIHKNNKPLIQTEQYKLILGICSNVDNEIFPRHKDLGVNFMVNHLSNVIDCLYDMYIYQANHLKQYGYTKEEAFWVHFASISFIPWSRKDRNIVPLSHLIRFYDQIYNNGIAIFEDSKPKSFTKLILQSKFNLTYALARQSLAGESNLECALDVGRCIFPRINDTSKLVLSGLIAMNVKPIYQRVDRQFSFGRLLRDIDEKHPVAKTEGKYATAL